MINRVRLIFRLFREKSLSHNGLEKILTKRIQLLSCRDASKKTQKFIRREPFKRRRSSIANDNYMIAPKTFSISNADLMTHKTFRIMDGNGLAFVDGFVGSYVNK